MPIGVIHLGLYYRVTYTFIKNIECTPTKTQKIGGIYVIFIENDIDSVAVYISIARYAYFNLGLLRYIAIAMS